ncbi:hypothetical protein DMB66_17715 [Actinoplanes sp. ATCC 53533]|uniref:hypothetical protein n=1 Tax=Actinoplanes sp. ATCC 53533 TaxID=1288362 RepID=UPI000F79B3EC|nr:hypothetical protein [Actinoplanes sp. ATCC 53533]RSM65113.1 hypothetical protein DMB66_17715 [Actinoplanes sp. ATCC 53533]
MSNNDAPPRFVPPNDDHIDPTEAAQRFFEALKTVDKEHPDVRLISAHAAVTVAAALHDYEDVSEENDRLTAQNRKLAARVARMEQAAKQAKRNLNEAVAAAGEARTVLSAERRLRRRAEQARDQALTASAPQPARDGGEIGQLRAELQQAHTELDELVATVEAADIERDAAIQRHAMLAIRLATLDMEEQDQPVEPPAAASFAEVLAHAEHPLLVLSLDQSITKGLDEHTHASGWRRSVAATLATMIAYATVKSDARQAGQSAGPDLADLRAFTRSGHDHVQISPTRVALSESVAVTGTDRLAQQRRFPVPRSVDAAGTALVLAHVRIGRRPPAPRLYYLDRTDIPGDGKIYVVYLGPHLDNRLTN